MVPDSITLVLLVITIIGGVHAVGDWLNPPSPPLSEEAANHDHAEHQ